MPNIFGGIQFASPLDVQEQQRQEREKEYAGLGNGNQRAGYALGRSLSTILNKMRYGAASPQLAEANAAQDVLHQTNSAMNDDIANGTDPAAAEVAAMRDAAVRFDKIGKSGIAAQLYAQAFAKEQQNAQTLAEREKLKAETRKDNAEAAYYEEGKKGMGGSMSGDVQLLTRENEKRKTEGLPEMTSDEEEGFLKRVKFGNSPITSGYADYVQRTRAAGGVPVSQGEWATKYSGDIAGAQDLPKDVFPELIKQRDKALNARQQIVQANYAAKLLDQGIRTGQFAGARQTISRFLNTVIGQPTNEKELTTRTDQYTRFVGRQVIQLLASGALGRPTDKDQELAEAVMGGNLDVNDPKVLAYLLRATVRSSENDIGNYNNTHDTTASRYPDVGSVLKSVDVPQRDPLLADDPTGFDKAQTPGPAPTVAPVRKELNGKTYEQRDGKWYLVQ